MDKPKKDFFLTNRQSLLKKTKADLIVVSANCMLQKSGDTTYPFIQDTNFWYLTGIDSPDVVLVLSNAGEFLITPNLSEYRQVFDGKINHSNLKRISGIDNIYNHSQGWTLLKNQLLENKNVAILFPNPVKLKVYDFYSQPARRVLRSKLIRINPKLTFEDLRPVLATMRMVKQPVEINQIKQAIKITNDTLEDVLNSTNLLNYKDSGQIEADISYGFRKRGASGDGFEPIIASGSNSTILHIQDSTKKLVAGDLIVVDVGAQYNKYSADISRTVIYGQPSSRQQAVYQAVKTVQASTFDLIKPGVLLKDIEAKVEYMLGQQLISLGVIKDTSRKSVRKYYTHAFSHSLGLDLHDVADYSQPLVKNMVITVEPGLYISEENIGIRIEDDVLVTDNGIEVLSKSLKTSLVI
jgi:Xaa-Pro aminopeptidase